MRLPTDETPSCAGCAPMENERQWQPGILGKVREKNQGEKVCADENLTELVVVVSNSDLSQELPPEPATRIIADALGASLSRAGKGRRCGSTTKIQTLAMRPAAPSCASSPSITVSGCARSHAIRFDATAVTWTTSGTEFDGTISWQIVVNTPIFENQLLDVLVTQPAYGYLNVVDWMGGFP